MWMLIALGACSGREVFDTPIPVDDTFVRRTPPAAALARYEAAAAYSEAHGGWAFMVLEGDEVVFEQGQNGHGLDEPHALFSGTKSFSCALFELARAQGLRPDDRVRAVLPALPAEAETLTFDHLVHLTSGMEQFPAWASIDNGITARRIPDSRQYALERSWITPPGQTFAYGRAHFDLFGAALQTRFGQDPLTWLETDVFAPIGLRTAGWSRDPAGHPALAQGAWTTVNEWAKFGVLVRDDGAFLGRQVLPPGLRECTTGSTANPAYGRAFWLNQEVPADVQLVNENTLDRDGRIIWNEGPADLFMAAGFHDQRLYILPTQDLVVVRLSDGSRRFRDRELLALLLGE